MSGRRSHVRFAVVQSPEGVLRVMRDVVVQGDDGADLIAISREPGVLGEAIQVAFPADEGRLPFRMRVAESQPIVTDGTVRHRLRLQAIRAEHDPGTRPSPRGPIRS